MKTSIDDCVAVSQSVLLSCHTVASFRRDCALKKSAMKAQLLQHVCVVALVLIVLNDATTFAMPQQAPGQPISEETLNNVLNDRRYLMRQLKCALGEAPCDPVGRRLKSLAPLVLRGSCPKCTADEMRQIQRVLSHIQRNFPKEWNKVVQQYSG